MDVEHSNFLKVVPDPVDKRSYLGPSNPKHITATAGETIPSPPAVVGPSNRETVPVDAAGRSSSSTLGLNPSRDATGSHIQPQREQIPLDMAALLGEFGYIKTELRGLSQNMSKLLDYLGHLFDSGRGGSIPTSHSPRRPPRETDPERRAISRKDKGKNVASPQRNSSTSASHLQWDGDYTMRNTNGNSESDEEDLADEGDNEGEGDEDGLSYVSNDEVVRRPLINFIDYDKRPSLYERKHKSSVEQAISVRNLNTDLKQR